MLLKTVPLRDEALPPESFERGGAHVMVLPPACQGPDNIRDFVRALTNSRPLSESGQRHQFCQGPDERRGGYYCVRLL